MLLKRIDDDWYIGRLGDQEGMFPIKFVEIIEDLPQERDPEIKVLFKMYISVCFYLISFQLIKAGYVMFSTEVPCFCNPLENKYAFGLRNAGTRSYRKRAVWRKQ